MPIKNIIFDLGGVILNLDHQKTIDAFNKLGATNANEIYIQATQHQWLNDFEIGKITTEQLRAFIKSKLNLTTTDEKFDSAWNAMLQDIPQNKLDFIRSLKQNGYKIFLLSNTNKLHLEEVRKIYGAKLAECFNKEYYSSEIKARKPDSKVFLTIINENGLEPNETLFLDDSLEHVDAARRIGMQAEHISNGKTIFNLMEILKNKQ